MSSTWMSLLASLGEEQEHKWVSFTLAQETFAVPAAFVQEVLMAQPIESVPLAPPNMAGLLNLRGQLMPALDLRRQFAAAAPSEAQASNLMVVKYQGTTVGMVVDSIGDVLSLARGGWQPTPDTLPAEYRSHVLALYPAGPAMILGLSLSLLVGEDNAVRRS